MASLKALKENDHDPGNKGSSEQAPNGTNGINGDHVEDEGEEENDWSEDEDGIDSIPMDSNLIIRVNYEKLDVALRNTRLLSKTHLPASIEIYDCLLRRIEYQTARCRDSCEIPREGEEGRAILSAPIQLSSIVEDVDPNLDLAGCIGPMEPSTVLNRRGKRPLDDDTNGVNGDDHEDEPRGRTAHTKSTSTLSHSEAWARKLRHLELERMIESRYGDVALRVVRVLHAKGKLGEKRLQEISLLPFKDLRQTLASMQTGEVPRDAQRQPSLPKLSTCGTTIRIVCAAAFLRIHIKLCHGACSASSLNVAARDFLDKTERTDVKGHEEEFLSEAELEHLRNWKAKEALLLAEVSLI
ncbi:RNA polymerase III Rpc82 C -terminal [Penicillium cf. griseofulvum]|nr:RNA polymerase III Rpc82 C -terminal [Penicillium cf. griseofulvum]